MRNPIMHRTRLMSVMATVIGSSLGIILAASVTDTGADERLAATVQLAQSCESHGPYATIRRANEVAYEARSRGFSTQVFHNGDGYYVRVC